MIGLADRRDAGHEENEQKVCQSGASGVVDTPFPVMKHKNILFSRRPRLYNGSQQVF